MTPLRTQYDEVAKGATPRPWHYSDRSFRVDYTDDGANAAHIAENVPPGDGPLLEFCVNNFESALREIERLEKWAAHVRPILNAIEREHADGDAFEEAILIAKRDFDRFCMEQGDK